MAGQSAFFVWANRGKQSVVLDVKHPDDAATLAALIAGADVFIHNLSGAAARRLGVDPATLVARHPALVACEISGYGTDGPRSGDKAYDLAIQAEAGAFSVTGTGEMSKVGFSVADICAGMYALSSILAALVRRERGGAGAAIEVSMLDALAEWMSAPMYNAVYGGGQPPRTGRRHHAIAVQSDAEFASLAEHLLEDAALAADPRFATNPARLAHVDDLEAIISATLAGLPVAEAQRRLADGRVAHARVNDLRGVWEHEQLRARGRFATAATPTGDVEVLRAPFDISDADVPVGRVPALDEHDETVVRTIIERGSHD
jgi:crotonobetainyl-CoA:carnitine CoA-transferase CaiB-like acyl-CoA transferase